MTSRNPAAAATTGVTPPIVTATCTSRTYLADTNRPSKFKVQVMISWDERSLIEDLLARGVDDWIDATEVYAICVRTGVADSYVLRALAVGLMAEVLARGLMIAGDIGHKGFEPWPGSPMDALGRIAMRWLVQKNPRTSVGEIGWLSNTPDGEYLGQLVLDREGHGRSHQEE